MPAHRRYEDVGSRARRAIDAAVGAAMTSTHMMRHGASIVSGSRVIASGSNCDCYSSYASRFSVASGRKPRLHAELAALVSCRSNALGADMAVVRVGKRGVLLNSKPCKMCMLAMRHAGIRRAYYSDGLGTFGVVEV